MNPMLSIAPCVLATASVTATIRMKPKMAATTDMYMPTDARTEQHLFDEVVTCYEPERLFERG